MSRFPRRTLVLAALATSASTGVGAFVLDGQIANPPGNLQPSGEPSIVLGGLKGVGNARVPWIAQSAANPGGGARQIFTVVSKNGVYTQEGDSLNFNPEVDADHPDIDFAGAGNKVPWSSWEEKAGGVDQIFASRFLPNGDLSNGVWEINGALRTGAGGSQRGPSLNVNVDKAATESRVAGGTLTAGGDPVPWVTWKEEAALAGLGEQIFVTKGLKDATPGAGQRGSFSWHLQGPDRGPVGLGPTLNIERERDGVHPDIAFTGPSNTVPWVVWYEEDPAGTAPANAKTQKVFAAKFIVDPTLGDRTGKWVPVGNQPGCGFAGGNENPIACALNVDVTKDAENPNVSAGALDPAKPASPWVAWKEVSGGYDRIFVSRLAGETFQLFRGPNADGSLNADPNQEANEPDLHFEANVLTVVWKEKVGTKFHTFSRTFTPGPGGQGGAWSAATDLHIDASRESGNPGIGSFGGSPFAVWAEGSGDPTRGAIVLKHDTAVPQLSTDPASAISKTEATVAGSLTGTPGVYASSIEFGPTVAYGQAVASGDIVNAAGTSGGRITGKITGLGPNSVIHFRTQVATALGVVTGPDQAFTTAGDGAPGASGIPPVPVAPRVTARPVVKRVQVTFKLSRKWKVKIRVHKGTLRGPVVSTVTAKFPKGRSTTLVAVPGSGRFVVEITPRAGKTIFRTVRV
jgi:hypothetical protein